MLHTEAFSNEDSMYMHRCLQLAACGAGSTSPNPMVGAVIVCDGRIIGEGYHIRAGEPHAEVNAVNSVRESDRHLLKSSTIYVSLEPCSHYGKTPPCCDLIISCGIPRVVIATTDSNLQVNGRGISRMEAAGIDVRVGLLGAESRRLNRAFFTSHSKQRPLVVLKWAQSADGFVDYVREGGSALAVSTPVSMVAMHKLRAHCDAILVGTRTAQLDNPSLNVRHWTGRQPLRLVIDRNGVLSPSLKLFDGSLPTVVYTSAVRNDLCGKNIEQIVLDFSVDILPQILSHLHSLKIGSLLVEGGPTLLQSFINAGLWDVARVETNPRITVEAGVPAPVLEDFVTVENAVCDGNTVSVYHK